MQFVTCFNTSSILLFTGMVFDPSLLQSLVLKKLLAVLQLCECRVSYGHLHTILHSREQ